MRRRWGLMGVSSLVVVTAYFAFANGKEPAPGPLTGTWQCVAHSSAENDAPFTLSLKQSREEVTGKLSNSSGEYPLTSSSYKKGLLEIHAQAPDGNYSATGRLLRGQLSGHWSRGHDAEGGWECQKQPAAK